MPTVCLVRLLANAEGPEVVLSAKVSRIEFSFFQQIVRSLVEELNVDGRSLTSDGAVKYRAAREERLELILQRFEDIALLPKSSERARFLVLNAWQGIHTSRAAVEFDCMYQDHPEVCQLMMIHTLPPSDE